MLKRCTFLFTLSLRDLTDRLDSFEKEVIELKQFRKAVESTSPEVAHAARERIKQEVKEVKVNREILANPLTAEEFIELTRFYAVQRAKLVPLENFLYVNTPDNLKQHASVVYREYLVRIAHRVRELSSCPYGLSQMPSIQELKRWYQWSFHDVKNVPVPIDEESCYKFDHCVRRVFLRHYNVSSLLSAGLLELAQREQWDTVNPVMRENYAELDEFFSLFCVGRAKLRLIILNYIYLSSNILNINWNEVYTYDVEKRTAPQFFGFNPESFNGLVCRECSLFHLTKWAVREAQQEYEDGEIEFKFCGDDDITFIGIPYSMYDIIASLLFDAIQVNVQRQELTGIPCGKISVTLSQRKNSKRYSIRISDTAGGTPLSEVKNLTTCWSTYDDMRKHDIHQENIKTWTRSPIRLPYANCVARAIGGDFRVASIEGYGTDRYVYFPASGIAGISIEVLNLPVKTICTR